jgi:surface protein
MATDSGHIAKADKLIIYMDAANSRSYTIGSTSCNCLVSTVSGTLEGGTSFTSEYKGGWVFGGSNDYINLGNRTKINPELNSFTTNIFFKIDSNSTSSNIISSKGNGADSDIGWLIYYSNTNDILTVRCNGNNTSSERAAQHISINKGQVYMVTMVINRVDNTIKGYLNGSNVGWINGNYIETFSGNSISGFGSITNSDDFLVGERPQLNLPMYGIIYLFQTYNFALSESQLLRNFRFFGGRYDLSVPIPPDTLFRMTIKTDNAGTSADDSFYLKLANGTTNVTVDWGDGNSDLITTWNQSELTHQYASSGTYQISMDGSFYGFTFQYSDHLKVMSIDNWGNNAFGWMSRSFWGCTNLTGTYTDIPNTSAVTSFNQTFAYCSNFNSPVEFDTSNVTDMNGMFWLALLFNQPVLFDTSNVTTMSGMFRSTGAFDQTINFDGSALTTANLMFMSSSVMTSPVTITNSTLLTDISSMFGQMGIFNAAVTLTTTNVTNMAGMFAYARFFNSTLTLNGGTANVTNFQGMFYYCQVFNQPVPFDTSSSTNMIQMFSNCWTINQSLSTFDTSNVIYMQSMFEQARAFDQDISHFVTTNVTNMSTMFKGASVFNQDINFDGAALTTTLNMFVSAALMTGDVTITNSTLLTNCSGMFGQMASFNGNVTLTTSAVTLMTGMFTYGTSFDSTVSTITFNGGTANVTNFSYMFYRCPLFNQPVTFLDTSSATNLISMFDQTNIFNQSVSHFNTTNVIYMNTMFYKSYLFDQDISSFNITSLTSATSMFQQSGFAITNYDLLLVAWDAYGTSSVVFHAGTAHYSAGAPVTAHNAMVSRGWTITDGGTP